jgi:uncharacterized protein (TIGR03435 family)
MPRLPLLVFAAGLTGPVERAASADWIFSALPPQLGLKLEQRKSPAEVLVIDAIAKPTLN